MSDVRSEGRFFASGRWLREAMITSGWLILTLLLLTVLASVWLSTSSNWTVRICTVAFTLLAVSRPAAALLVTTALLGFGVTLAHMAGAPLLRVTEVLVVGSLAGCALHAVRPGSALRQALARQGSAPVVLLGVAAVASLVVWQRVYQVETGDPPAYFEALVRVLSHEYFFHPGDFRLLVSGALLLEGLAIYVVTAALCRVDGTFFPRSLRMLVLGGAGLGVLSAVRLAEIMLRNPEALAAMRATSAGLRISPQIPDYIAAGSYFALCWLVSLGLALAWRRGAWLLAGVPLMGAIYLTGSRSVVAAAIVGLAVLALAAARERAVAIRRVVLFAGIAIAVMVFSFSWMTGRDIIGRSAALSMETRWELALTTVRVIETRPVFGVGFDRRHLLAKGLTSERLDALWHGSPNAHNDFLRIGAELGVVGMGLLIWIVVAAGRRIVAALHSTADVRLAGLAGGLLAFLTTSMVSDPLSFREVSYAFWIGLGLAVGHAATLVPQAEEAAAPSRSRARVVTWSVVLLLGGLLVASIPYRARQELRGMDMRHVTLGFYEWGADPDGTVNRWSGPQATFYVDGRARAVEVPLSGVMPGGVAQQVEVRVDGRPANRVTVGSEWQVLRVAFPGGDSSDARRIDLLVSPTWVPAEAFGNDDRRVLGVKVGLIRTLMPSGEHR